MTDEEKRTAHSDRRKARRAEVRELKRLNLIDDTPDILDENRCHARSFDGKRCALDVGHYRSNMDPDPCPHIAEGGEEWFGVRTPTVSEYVRELGRTG